MRHTFLFNRVEGGEGTTAAAVLTISTEGPSANSHDEAFQRFRSAVSDWLNESPEGQIHWEKSEGLFNIADAIMAGLPQRTTFVHYQEKYGITVHELSHIGWDEKREYDLILNDEADTGLAEEMDICDLILKAAKTHGEDSEPDHEVGDLQDCLRAAVGLMSKKQLDAFQKTDAVLSTLEAGGLLQEA